MSEADAFMEQVSEIAARDPRLTPLHAAVLAALGIGAAADTRSFAKVFGVAHALVLRTVSDLADGFGLVSETGRDARTQRARLALTEAGRRLIRGPVAA